MLKASYSAEELAEMFKDAGPPTPDDMSITNDGRRLDSAEAVIEFFEEIRAQREAETRAGSDT